MRKVLIVKHLYAFVTETSPGLHFSGKIDIKKEAPSYLNGLLRLLSLLKAVRKGLEPSSLYNIRPSLSISTKSASLFWAG